MIQPLNTSNLSHPTLAAKIRAGLVCRGEPGTVTIAGRWGQPVLSLHRYARPVGFSLRALTVDGQDITHDVIAALRLAREKAREQEA